MSPVTLFVSVLTHGVAVTGFFVGWHTISHEHISSLPRLLQHTVLNFRKGAVLRLQAHCIQDLFRHLLSHVVGLHIVIQSCWSASLALIQIVFPPIERLLEIGEILHSFGV